MDTCLIRVMIGRARHKFPQIPVQSNHLLLHVSESKEDILNILVLLRSPDGKE
jgi:hypothetical protein